MRAVSVIAKYAGIFHPGSSDGTRLTDDLSEANISKNHYFVLGIASPPML